MDLNNNTANEQDLNPNGGLTDFDRLTADNVEEELRRLKLIEENYVSDDEFQDKVRLTGKGIDIRLLKAGQDVEFELDKDGEDNYNWEDECDTRMDYEKIFKNRKYDMIFPEDDDDGTNKNDDEEADEQQGSSKTPFEVLTEKMTDISPNKDGMVLKRILTPGSGIVVPLASRVRVHYNAYFEMNDEPFDSTYLRNKSFEFKLGDGSVVKGLDVAVSTMKRYERSQFIFDPEYYIGKGGCPPRVPPDTPVLFEVEVISFIEANDYDNYEAISDEQRSKLSLEQMLKICNCLRELGNDNYKRENYREASKKYRKSIYLLENANISTEEGEKKWKSVMLKLALNMSQVSLKQLKPKKAIFYCKSALEYDPENVKALFRYGQSLRILQDFERARKFLTKAYNLAPTNKSIQEEIEKLNEQVEKYKILEKDIYKKMFNPSPKPLLALENGSTSDLNVETNDNDAWIKSKEAITKSLKDFASNQNANVLRIKYTKYSNALIEFIEKQIELLNLSIRKIFGENENVLQIMKN